MPEYPLAPETARDPVIEELHGQRIEDPYRWLEGDGERVAEWTERQNEYARAVLDTPERDALVDRFDELARVTDYGPLRPAGDRYLQRVEDSDADQPAVCVRESPTGERRVLLDPDAWSDEGVVSVDWFVPRGDGDLLAYGVSEAGREQYDVRVVDVDSGEQVDEVADAGRVNEGGFAWAAGGFYYVATGGAGVDDGRERAGDTDDGTESNADDGTESNADDGTESNADDGKTDADDPADGGSQLDKELRFHELGSDGADRLVTADIGERTWPTLEAEGETLFVQFFHGWERGDLYGLRTDATDPDADLDLSPVFVDYDATFEPTLADGDLYVLTDHDAPRYRLLRGDAMDVLDAAAGRDPPEPGDLREAVPEGEAVLRSVDVAGDSLLVHAHRDARSVARVHARDGAFRRELDLPSFATVTEVHAGTADGGDREAGNHEDGADGGNGENGSGGGDGENGAGGEDGPTAGTDEAFFLLETFAEPQRACRADLEAGTIETLFAPDVGVDADLSVSQEWFESADGTDVPAFVVHREGLDSDGGAPTVLTGYGGFRVNRTPTFDRFRAPFLEAGGVFVLATLRGGSEYGETWHDAGRRANKRHVFEDAIAVAEGLVERGYTRPERLGVTGGSNGGLLVGALLTRRPDLFGAAVCRVPLLDMLRFHRFLLGESWTVEYGHPEDPEAFAYLREYSPYHNVAERAYPPTLLTTAAGDTRVHPGHARKMTARLQANQTADAPVVLRTEEQAGHGVGKPTSMLVRERADEWGFLAHHLGVDL